MKLFRWFISDREGNVVIWQNPNLPLIVWILAFILAKTLPYGQLNFIAELVSYGASFTWAWLEITGGQSPLRRVLGIIVMIVIILARI